MLFQVIFASFPSYCFTIWSKFSNNSHWCCQWHPQKSAAPEFNLWSLVRPTVLIISGPHSSSSPTRNLQLWHFLGFCIWENSCWPQGKRPPLALGETGTCSMASLPTHLGMLQGKYGGLVAPKWGVFLFSLVSRNCWAGGGTPNRFLLTAKSKDKL